jgi:hypothetical protein
VPAHLLALNEVIGKTNVQNSLVFLTALSIIQ